MPFEILEGFFDKIFETTSERNLGLLREMLRGLFKTLWKNSEKQAKTEQLSAEARKANTILAQVGMHVRQRDKLLSETFVDMDLNQHGSLSYQELRGGLDRIGVHLNNDDYSLLLSKVDADNNGRVEFQEFAHAVKADVRDTAAPTPMTGPVLGADGQPIRVGEFVFF